MGLNANLERVSKCGNMFPRLSLSRFRKRVWSESLTSAKGASHLKGARGWSRGHLPPPAPWMVPVLYIIMHLINTRIVFTHIGEQQWICSRSLAKFFPINVVSQPTISNLMTRLVSSKPVILSAGPLNGCRSTDQVDNSACLKKCVTFSIQVKCLNCGEENPSWIYVTLEVWRSYTNSIIILNIFFHGYS